MPTPRSQTFLFDLGLTCAAMGANEAAIGALRQATQLNPNNGAAWRKLGDLLSQAGDREAAEAAYISQEKATDKNPLRPGKNLAAAKIERAEQNVRDMIAGAPPQTAANLLRAHLMTDPVDFAALRMLAQLGLRGGQSAAMEKLLERALDLAPTYVTARQNYVFVLLAQNKAAQALPHIDSLLAHDRRDTRTLRMRAKAFTIMGEHARAVDVFEAIRNDAAQPGAAFWLSYAHTLKYVGRRADSVRAYRTCIDLVPTMGDAYWGLANLKTEIFSAADVAAMRVHLAGHGLAPQDRIAMHYALGRGLEQMGDYAGSFSNYASGAALKRAQRHYDADAWSGEIRRIADFFTASRFADAAGVGCPDESPIFIVGLRRAGSTLIEQILASHSAVEGTQELPTIADIVREIAGSGNAYPECLGALGAAEIGALGEKILQRSQVYRRTAKPFFVDKMPSNWVHAGLIELVLPNAKIIDARRHPMASCVAAFKQYFGDGPAYSYDLGDLGRYYRDYLDLMAHFDAVLPGRIHRVGYENMVLDTEAEIRRLLDYCGLPFEPGCLRFWENKRAVGTPSAEQVRQPIYREGLEQWRDFEPWLGPLKAALEKEAVVF